MIADRRTRASATADAGQACCFHQSFNALPAHMHAAIGQLSVDSRGTIEVFPENWTLT